MKKVLLYGILASLFFAFTFILNRNMNLARGYWLRIACLRYLLTLPTLVLTLTREEGMMAEARGEICLRPFGWVLWSTVGFGLSYAPLIFGPVFGESRLIAATWRLTIVAGVFPTPLFGKKMPVRNLSWSSLILAGIFLLQVPHLRRVDGGTMFLTSVPILAAILFYPLGNRKMIVCCPLSMSTIKRVFGMTLYSIPLWLLLSLWAAVGFGLPGRGQVMQSLRAALLSSVIAAMLFFRATNMVEHNPRQLAVVKVTQYGEVVFTLLGDIFLLQDGVPDKAGLADIAVTMAGVIGNSLVTQEK